MYEVHGEIWYIEAESELFSEREKARRMIRRVPVSRPVFWCDAASRQLLRKLWTDVFDCGPNIRRRVGRARFMEAEIRKAVLEGEYLARTRIGDAAGRWRGEIGLRSPRSAFETIEALIQEEDDGEFDQLNVQVLFDCWTG